MAVTFKSATKHGRLQFYPGVVFEFKDARAEEYFVKAGFATKAKGQVQQSFPKGSVDIDPETVFANSDKKVLG